MLEAIDIKKVENANELWQEIVDTSSDGWFWHTWSAHEFNLCAGQQYGAVDHSFFIYENGHAVGVAPLIVQEKNSGSFRGREATYYSGFLPWPCFRGTLKPEQRTKLEDFACVEIERRAREAGAGRIRARLTPPRNCGDEEARVARIAPAHSFTLRQFGSHVVSVTENTLQVVRERYRRYYKKYAPLFTFSIVEGSSVTSQLEEIYYRLHIKDSGGQSRSRESYTKQANIARAGEAFYVVATHTESKAVVGMLLVSLYKNVAYDNSVAVDPDFSDRYVGHLMKWRAIEELQKRQVPTYELGPKADPLSATPKELGISHFKEGWSRGNTRTIWEMDKLLNTK